MNRRWTMVPLKGKRRARNIQALPKRRLIHLISSNACVSIVTVFLVRWDWMLFIGSVGTEGVAAGTLCGWKLKGR